MREYFIKMKVFFLPIILAAFIVSCGLDGAISSSVNNAMNAPEKKVFPKALIAGGDQTVEVKSTVKLDGSPSFDPQQELLTYAWTLDEIPNGSAATLATAATAVVSFVADKGGFYTASLQVTNVSTKSSEVATVTIDVVGTGGNHPPVAIAGADVTVVIATTEVAALDGSASHDADEGDEITYTWFLLGAPTGAEYAFLETHTNSPQLYPYTVGIYTVELQVSDGIDVDMDLIVITAE
jgi:PKD repeat protein